jgi:hypothetical protein
MIIDNSFANSYRRRRRTKPHFVETHMKWSGVLFLLDRDRLRFNVPD